jgi:alkanesulfonate monooxygenase SsuD/methylene tetrahydromethanopterin reductase-like flavin-dependent oxidoreductase (luciferase family)
MTQLLFGMNVGTSTAADEDPLRLAQLAEDAGFDFVSASDHPYSSSPCFETATLLTWILARTERVRVLSRVFGLPLRHEAMLAKAAESMQRLSAGRLILGHGSGGSEDEFRSIGLPTASPGERLAALEEGVTVMRQLWNGESVTFDGRYQRIAGAQLRPAPRDLIPVWLGTFGPRALELTGRLADGWIPSLGYRPTREMPAMLNTVREAAEAAGRDPDSLTYALNTELEVGGDRGDGHIAGSPDEIVQQLSDFVRHGFTAFNFILKAADPADMVGRVATEIVPAVRDRSAVALPLSR